MSVKLNRVGEKYITNEGYEIEIVEYNGAMSVEVAFNNGYKTRTDFGTIKKGKVKNPYHKSLFGVGYFGVGHYKCGINNKLTKSYKCWSSMLQRCYDEKWKEASPTYKDVIVCEEWHNFQVFSEWFYKNYVEGWQLDKDILVKGNKIYSPQTCCFVPAEINLQFTKRTNKPSQTIKKRGKSFEVRVSINNKNTTIGTFKTEEEAKESFIKARTEVLNNLIKKHKNQLSDRVYTFLESYEIEKSI